MQNSETRNQKDAIIILMIISSFVLGFGIAMVSFNLNIDKWRSVDHKEFICSEENATLVNSSFHRFKKQFSPKQNSNKFMITIVCEDKK